MKKPKSFIGWAVLALLAATGLGPSARAESFPVGVVAPLSGGGADYGTAFQRGIQMAVDDANKRGGITVSGKPYTIAPVFCDDEFKPDKAVNCGRSLAAQNRVSVVMTPSSLAAFPMMGFNQQEGFLLLASSQTPKFTQLGDKLAVRLVNNTDRTMGPWVDLLSQYFKTKGMRIDKVAMMVVNTELGKTWADNFAKSWKRRGGAGIVGTASYDANDTDFYPQLSTLLPNEPDAIVLTTVCQPSSIVIKQARELGFKGPFIQSAACSGEELARLLPPDQLDGTIVEIGGWGLDKPDVDAFRAAFRDRYHEAPQAVAGQGYDGLRWVTKAVELAGTTTDATRIRAAMGPALAQTPNMFGMANLDDKGDADMPMYVGVLTGGKVSTFTGAK